MDIKNKIIKAIHDIESRRGNIRELTTAEIVEELTSELEQQRDEEKQIEYEPYFGWCDVEGCKNEGSGGGIGWRETGYWTLCMDHNRMARESKKQPEMKQSAIDRENSRDKLTGYLKSK